MDAMLSKLMPPFPLILLLTPVKISVVAFPKIFGPTILKIVLPIANRITKTNPTQYLPS